MIRERIIKYIESKGVSKYKFYKTTGLSNGFLDKEGAIGSDKCEIIIYHYTDLNPTWLLTGNGEMLTGSIPIDEPKGVFYKELFEQKETELKELNREVGRLQAEIQRLRSYGVTDSVNLAAEKTEKYKGKK